MLPYKFRSLCTLEKMYYLLMDMLTIDKLIVKGCDSYFLFSLFVYSQKVSTIILVKAKLHIFWKITSGSGDGLLCIFNCSH